MAKIRDYAITIYSAATASMVCEMPEHATGDLLVAFVNKDTASVFTTPAGWTAQQTQISAGAAGGVYTKRAASSSETVTFTLTSETCCGVIVAVQNVNGSTDADAVSGSAKSGADDSTLPISGVGITPSHDNCLVLHGLSTDSGGGFNALPPWVNLFAGDAGANSLCVSYTQQKTAAAITAPDHWGGLQDDARGFIIAIRDDGAGAEFDAYIPLGATAPASQITPLNGSTGTVDKGAWAAVSTPLVSPLNGKTVTGLAIAATADSGINPFRGSARNAGSSSTTQLNACSLDLTTSFDATALEGLVFGTFLNAAPRDYVDTGTAAQGGKFILLGSDASNYKSWVVGGQFTKTERPDARNNYLIEVASSDTVYASAGTANFASMDDLMIGSSGYYGAPSVLWNELYLLGVATLAGGGTAAIDFEDVIFAVNNGCGILPLMQQAGSGATCWISLKFGGVDPIHIACNLNTFQYPRKADEIDYVDFHVSNNKVGIEFDGQDRGGGDVDTLHFTNCLFTSPSSYYWRFASTHDVGADVDFSGTSVVNAAVTLRSSVTLDSVNFINCTSFTLNAATLTNCEFSDTTVSAAAPGDADNISSSSFTSSGTGHAIEIGGTAADITLTGLTFTGYAGTNGSSGNEAIYVNIASGSMTITISGGTTPSIRTAGATVTVVTGAVDTTITVLDITDSSPIENARVLVLAGATGPLPSDDTVTITRSGTTATVTHTAHGMSSATKIQIKGAAEQEYNGIYTVTVSDANTYTYTVSGSPATPATGTIKATAVIIDGLTNASGVVSDTRSYASDQQITGRVRKATSGTLYKTGVISGTVDSSSGFSAAVQLIRDT